MPLKMQIAESYDTPVWRRWLQELPDTIDDFTKEELIQGGRNQLFRRRFEGVEIVVKRFPNRDAWKKIVYRICQGKAKRSYLHSERLNQAGLNSPEPIAWLETWEGPWLKDSFYICVFAPFEHEARELKRSDLPARDAKARLLGQSLAKMHQANILHLDLTPGNLLYTSRKEDEWEIQIVDNNRMRFGPVGPRIAMTSLVQADLPDDLVSPMLSAYAESNQDSLGDLEKAYWKRRRSYELKWRIKNATRPLRRKIGL
jgi:tRNA A-37 threonylcarbamoyl transferase component Bud32